MRGSFYAMGAGLLCLAGCGDGAPAPAPPELGVPPARDVAEASLCEPLAVSGCTADGKAEVRCRGDGSEWHTAPCRDDRGQPSVCLEGRCLACTPLRRRCLDDDRVETCAEDGSGWSLAEGCNGVATGQVCELGACVMLCELNLKWNSYMGCEYFGADLDNGFVPGENGGLLDAAGAQYAIIVSNPDPRLPAAVEIHDSDGPVLFDSDGNPLPKGKILPRDLRVYRLPRRDVNGTVQAALAYRVTTSIPTVVYQFNPLADEEVYSNDASLLLPANVLGKWYYIMTREQTHDVARGYLTVLAIRDGTEVTVTVSAKTVQGPQIPALSPGESISRNLNAFDVLNLETDGLGEDLTGSQVVASRRVAVFGGSEGANVPNTEHCGPDGFCEWDGETPCESHADCRELITCCADHIEQQLFPVPVWGTSYRCARTQPRGNEPEVWRILAARDDTVVTTVPPQANIPVLHAGEHFELQAPGDFELFATQPVLVGQFMASEHAPGPGLQSGDARIGDPAFMLVVPDQQLRTDYVVLTPPDFDQDFVNVVAPLGAVVSLDGVEVLPEAISPIGSGDYGVARLPVADGVHVLEGDAPFAVLAYGWDQYVSYGYPGGLNLGSLGLLEEERGPFAD